MLLLWCHVQIEMEEGAAVEVEKEAEESGAGGEHLDGEQLQVGGCGFNISMA